ncbi:MAG: hypothetical protein EBT80_00615 [Chitinophagales bacterium]|nr:hypothetical protein [Chitinophagales bacterium]
MGVIFLSAWSSRAGKLFAAEELFRHRHPVVHLGEHASPAVRGERGSRAGSDFFVFTAAVARKKFA